MTISTETRKYRYEGDGVVDTFAFDNRIFATSDLTVQLLTRATDAVVSTLTETTDYTVTILSNGNASVEVTNVSKIPSASQDILLKAETPITQANSLPTGTPFPAKTVENALDKVTVLVQEMQEQLDRGIKVPANSSTTADLELPTPEANKFFRWNADADGLKNVDISTLGAVVVGTSGDVVGKLNANKTDSGANTFTGQNTFESNVTISATTARVIIQESDATANEGRTVIAAAGDEFLIGTASDASVSIVQQAMRVERTGTTIDAVRFPNGINPNSSGGNILANYEEGTFTPTVGGSTLVGTQAYTTQFGQYTRVGRLVTATWRVVVNGAFDTVSSTGNLRVYGLPYTIKAGSSYRPAVSNSLMLNINITAATSPSGYGVQNTTSLQYYIQSVTTGSNFTVAMCGTNMDISGTITYEV